MRYVLSCWDDFQADEAYRIYLTTCMKQLVENSAHACLDGEGKMIDMSYIDIIDPKPKPPEKSAEEIIAETKRKIME